VIIIVNSSFAKLSAFEKVEIPDVNEDFSSPTGTRVFKYMRTPSKRRLQRQLSK
jgi:hypothetical protein